MEGENEKPTVFFLFEIFLKYFVGLAFTVYLSVLDSNSCCDVGEHGELGL